MYSLKSNPETRNPLKTKNKSTPIQPILTVKENKWMCLNKTNNIAIPLKKSSSFNLINICCIFDCLLFIISANSLIYGLSFPL
jgi:hypothetical protein